MKYILSLLLTVFFYFSGFTQQTLVKIEGWNAWVHLPANYTTTTQAFPTIVFFPGLGEVGTDPNKLIAYGPNAFIKQGWSGVADSTQFIVISLQPAAAYPSEPITDKVIQAVKKAYRVGRLFMTGLSHGSWVASTFVTGDAMGGNYYASQVTAVVNVQGMKPDDNSPYPNLFANFANAGGRYLAFEQKYDGRYSDVITKYMNVIKPNSGIHIFTNFGNGGHCCWNEYYGGGGIQPKNFMIDGKNQNIYQWMASVSVCAA